MKIKQTLEVHWQQSSKTEAQTQISQHSLLLIARLPWWGPEVFSQKNEPEYQNYYSIISGIHKYRFSLTQTSAIL